ncbi:MAG: YfhO family protein, partial [Acidobacteriota bacterium]
EEVRAHDPMANDQYMGFLRLTTGYKTGPENYHPWYEDNETSVLDFLNVRYLLQDPWYKVPDPSHWRLIYDRGDGKIFENLRSLPRFYAVRNVTLEFRDQQFHEKLEHHSDFANTALLENLEVEVPQMRDDFFNARPANAPPAVTRILSAEPSSYRLSVSAPRWSLVVSSVPWWPGWKVIRNGTSIKPIRVNGAFLGFAVPPGQSDVRVYYSPRSWWVGVALASIGMGILVALNTRGRFTTEAQRTRRAH